MHKLADSYLQETNKRIHLVCLNIWGGYLEKPLLNFVDSHQEVDIFCFQEVYKNFTNQKTGNTHINPDIFARLEEKLPNHIGFFRPALLDSYGIAIFLRKDINLLEEGYINIYANPTYIEEGTNHPRNMQWLKCRSKNKAFLLMNMHGLWNGMGKNDSKDRLIQSKKIKQYMKSVKMPKILCGDFNLGLHTKSIVILEEEMNNLVRHYNVVSTRSSLYEKEEKHSDYIFTSPEITVIDFKAWNDIVSDHAPLSLIFSIA